MRKRFTSSVALNSKPEPPRCYADGKALVATMTTAMGWELMFSTDSASAYRTIKYTLHLYGAPLATAWGMNASGIQAGCDLPQRGSAGGLQLRDDRRQIGS